MMKMKISLLVLALAVLSIWNAKAQSTFGSIIGSIQDQSGAVVPGVAIEITNLDTQATRTATSNEAGQYSILNLLEGRYSLVATKAGFSANHIEQIVLEARQERRVDIVLGLSASTQSVRVEAVATAVDTENSVIAHAINNNAVESLPSNFRGSTTSPLGAIVAMPNVQQDSNGTIAVGGELPFMTRYTVDGTSNNRVLGGRVGNGGEVQENNMPSTEILDEFRVSAVGNNAEFQGTGDVTITTKSGANTFHGSAFEYLQNSALDAKTYGSPTKQAKAWNTFGGSLGGPIVHNNTFFFVDYEGNRKPGSQLVTGTVPTDAMRGGNLNGLTSGRSDGLIVDPTTGSPFPNNTIPVGRINSVATNFLNAYYPRTNAYNGSLTDDYRNQIPIPASTNGYDIRIDQHFGSKNLLYGRWDWKNIDTVQLDGNADPTHSLLPPRPQPVTNRNVTIADTQTFTSNLLNEFRFGWARTIEDESLFPLKGKDVVKTLGLTGIDLNGANMQGNGPFGYFDFSDGTGFTTVSQGTGVVAINQVYQVVDNVSWTKGNHTFKFGGEVYWDKYTGSPSVGADDIGWYTFNQGIFSGNAFADFLLGLPTDNFVWTPTVRQVGGHTARGGVFAQDTYRVTSSLTLTYGLRYDLLPQSIEPNGVTASFLPSPAGSGTWIFSPKFTVPESILYLTNVCPGAQAGWAGVPNPPFPCTGISRKFGDRITQTDYHDFRPRLGLAWRPFGNNKTVFRGGIGLFTVARSSGQQAFSYTGNVVPNAFFFNPNFSTVPPTPTWTWPAAQPASINQSLTPDLIGSFFTYYGDPFIKNHPLTQWNVGIERELPANWALHLNYIGSNAAGLGARVDINQCYPGTQPYNPACKPFPNFGNLSQLENIAFSNYQAFNPAIEHRYSNGLQFRLDYTWAKSLGTSGGEDTIGFGQGSITDRFHLGAMRGNNGGIRRNRVLATATYELPVGKGRTFLSNSNTVINGILGGWQISSITLIETGPYLTPYISCALSQTNTNDNGRGQVSCRPDDLGINPNLSNPSPNAPWWNINAFAPTPANVGRIGSAGVGILRGPGTVAISGGLSKVFTITEKIRLRVEGSFTNLPNHPNFAPPATNVSDPVTFGRIVTTQTAEGAGNRVGQVSGRIDF
jgi:hypothetical protein